MKIARYIGELLFDYECVVIPGLGGFIAEDKPVKVNRVTDKFSPPYRKIHFNIHLRANDGLLVNFVAAEENISYKIAKQRVDKFVFLCQDALEKGKKINFKHIGSIYLDNDRNIVFNQDDTINYNADSFGLSPLVSPSIRRTTDEEKIKKVVKSAIDKTLHKEKPVKRTDVKPEVSKRRTNYPMKANRKASPLRNQVIFLAVIIFFMGLGYVYMRRDAMMYYYDKYSSRIPFFYTNVNGYLSDNINSMPVAKISQGTASFFPFVLEKNESTNNAKDVKAEVDDSEITEENIISAKDPVIPEEKLVIEENITEPEIVDDPIKEESSEIKVVVPEEKKVLPEVKPTLSTDKFFIIAGSFTKEDNAKSYVNELKSQGFDALIADTNKYGMFRVAFMSFSNRKDADKKLLAIRKNTNSQAWLLAK